MGELGSNNGSRLFYLSTDINVYLVKCNHTDVSCLYSIKFICSVVIHVSFMGQNRRWYEMCSIGNFLGEWKKMMAPLSNWWILQKCEESEWWMFINANQYSCPNSQPKKSRSSTWVISWHMKYSKITVLKLSLGWWGVTAHFVDVLISVNFGQWIDWVVQSPSDIKCSTH